jgi:protein-S-isoprenylcysteine O-methyltransferase Ste14
MVLEYPGGTVQRTAGPVQTLDCGNCTPAEPSLGVPARTARKKRQVSPTGKQRGMSAISEKIIHFRPPRISMLFLVLASATHWMIPAGRIEIYASHALAVIATIGGFTVMMWAWWQFQQAETAICPTADSRVLVASGVYRLTRNPMYLGIVLMMAGMALWFGTLPYYLVAVLYFLVINQVFCPFEEERLIATFGKEYSEYRRKVRCWV